MAHLIQSGITRTNPLNRWLLDISRSEPYSRAPRNTTAPGYQSRTGSGHLLMRSCPVRHQQADSRGSIARYKGQKSEVERLSIRSCSRPGQKEASKTEVDRLNVKKNGASAFTVSVRIYCYHHLRSPFIANSSSNALCAREVFDQDRDQKLQTHESACLFIPAIPMDFPAYHLRHHDQRSTLPGRDGLLALHPFRSPVASITVYLIASEALAGRLEA